MRVLQSSASASALVSVSVSVSLVLCLCLFLYFVRVYARTCSLIPRGSECLFSLEEDASTSTRCLLLLSAETATSFVYIYSHIYSHTVFIFSRKIGCLGIRKLNPLTICPNGTHLRWSVFFSLSDFFSKGTGG